MASVSVPGVFFCGNLHYLLLGKHGLSPCHGGGPRAPFLFDRGVAGIADPTRPPVYPFPFFHHLVMGYDPVRPEFLVRPQLLTRIYSPLWGHPLAIRFFTFHRPTKQKRRSTSQGAKGPLNHQWPEKKWVPDGPAATNFRVPSECHGFRRTG